MQRRRLGRTNLSVSALCLGSMTWGSQNTEAEAHEQIDVALDHGVDFIDTAEMYPVTPHSPKTTGASEEIIGSWIASRKRREDVIVATKVVGAGYQMIRDGAPISAETINTAVEASLRKLQTDYIDLYQLHWPNRGSYHFRQHWTYDPSRQDRRQALQDIETALVTLDGLVKAGKVRHIGLSNETAWGVTQFVQMAERAGLPRIVSIQNEYSLMRRLFDLDLAEVAHHEDVGLLAYTPLAGGLLTGKYRDGAMPDGSRATIMEGLGGRMTENGMRASAEYCAVAEKHGFEPAQMALAWCLERPFMTSVIFGATTIPQLKNALATASVRLNDAVRDDILAVYRRYHAPF